MEHFHFVLEAIDPETDCAADSVVFEVENMQEIKKIVDENGTLDDFRVGYSIDKEEFSLIVDRFNLKFHTHYKDLYIRLAHHIDLRPYRVHTNRELYMMLKCQKPMAVFAEPFPKPAQEELPEEKFDKFVEAGVFVKSEFTLMLPEHRQRPGMTGVRFVMYTQKDEIWRAQAYKMMREVSQKSGWNEGFERMEGVLLGYTDWENDIHIEILRKNRKT